MEPQIQYTKTEDGATIAFWAVGTGPPIVFGPSSATNSLRSWRQPEGRAFFERLAAHHTVVRYDRRGFGQSQPGTPDFSLEGGTRDLAAVLDRLGSEPAVLCAYIQSGPTMFAYAAERPERVSHLIAWVTTARGYQLFPEDTARVLDALAEVDYDLFAEAIAAAVRRAAGTAVIPLGYAESFKEMEPEAGRAFMRSQSQPPDVSAILPTLKQPTLVLHRRRLVEPSLAEVQDLAARIPDARLVLLEGDEAPVYAGDADAVLAAIEEFLGVSAIARMSGDSGGGFATILLTDMASSTPLTQQLGDVGAQEVRRAHNEIVRQALAANAGSEIKHTGDGIMASFSTASSALDAAIAIQRGVAEHKREHPDSPLAVYVGLNAGEPIAEDDDLFGTSINLAARICDHAEPGQIVAADVVRQLAAGKDFLFADLGETELRGFEDPVKLWELNWQPAG